MPSGIRGGKKARTSDPKKAKVRHADGSSRPLHTRAGWVSSESEAGLRAQLFEEPEEEDQEPELEVATPASGGASAASAPAPRTLVWEVDESESEERPLSSSRSCEIEGEYWISGAFWCSRFGVRS